MSTDDEVREYAYVSDEQFTLALHYFHSKYVSAELGKAERRRFRMEVHQNIATTGFYLTITQPIDMSKQELDFMDDLERLGWTSEGHGVMDSMDVDAENADSEALRPVTVNNLRPEVSGATESHGGLPQYSPQAQQPYVVYEIHYEQTYQAPILTFSLKDLPPCDSAMDVDVIYRYLVPDHFKSVIRNYGPAGAIGARPHPIGHYPTFFVHPCGTKEAMEQISCSIKDYIQIWLGLVGPAVDLKIPLVMGRLQI